MSKETGGPAFPLPSAAYKEPIPGETELFGMTLRDYFAAKAMVGLMLPQDVGSSPNALFHMAKQSYVMADAMLKARQQ